MKESDLEKQVVKRIEQLNGVALKFTSPGNAGVPDRLILLNGKVYFAEIKAPGKKLRKLQQYWVQRLESLGFKVFVVDSLESMELMIDAIHTS